MVTIGYVVPSGGHNGAEQLGRFLMVTTEPAGRGEPFSLVTFRVTEQLQIGTGSPMPRSVVSVSVKEVLSCVGTSVFFSQAQKSKEAARQTALNKIMRFFIVVISLLLKKNCKRIMQRCRVGQGNSITNKRAGYGREWGEKPAAWLFLRLFTIKKG